MPKLCIALRDVAGANWEAKQTCGGFKISLQTQTFQFLQFLAFSCLQSLLTWWRGDPKGKGDTTLGLGLPCWAGGCLLLMSSAISVLLTHATLSSLPITSNLQTLGRITACLLKRQLQHQDRQEGTKAGFLLYAIESLARSKQLCISNKFCLATKCTGLPWRETGSARRIAWSWVRTWDIGRAGVQWGGRPHQGEAAWPPVEQRRRRRLLTPSGKMLKLGQEQHNRGMITAFSFFTKTYTGCFFYWSALMPDPWEILILRSFWWDLLCNLILQDQEFRNSDFIQLMKTGA